MTNPNHEQTAIPESNVKRNEYVLTGASVGGVVGMLAGVGLESIVEDIPAEIVAGSLMLTGAVALGGIANAIYKRRSS